MLRVLYWLLLVMAELWGYGNQILVGNGSVLVKVSEIDDSNNSGIDDTTRSSGNSSIENNGVMLMLTFHRRDRRMRSIKLK